MAPCSKHAIYLVGVIPSSICIIAAAVIFLASIIQLKSKNIEFEERMIGKEWTMEQFLESVPGAKTVPQIILDDKLIGTYEDLKNYLK